MAIPKNQTEIQALETFRVVAQGLGFEDGVLMRFLRSRGLDMAKAEDMIRKFVIWRVESEANQFHNWIPPEDLFNFDVYFTGFDYEGRAVFWAQYGHWPYVRDLLDKGMETDIIRFAGKHMDRVYRLLLKTKHQQFVAIVDSDGVTFSKVFYEARNWKGFTTLMRLLSDYEANFPELLHKAFMINTPLAFMWGWKFLSPFFSEYTLSKVNFYGSSNSQKKTWKCELFQGLPESAIPQAYGGSARPILLTDDIMESIEPS